MVEIKFGEFMNKRIFVVKPNGETTEKIILPLKKLKKSLREMNERIFVVKPDCKTTEKNKF